MEYLKYGFIQSPTNLQQPMCLVCEENFSNEAMKPSRLLEHLQKIHPAKSGKTLAFFHSLRNHFLKRKTMNMFPSSSKKSDDGLKASYISLLIAKAGKPHIIGEELILLAVKEVIKTVLHKSPEQVIKSIPPHTGTTFSRLQLWLCRLRRKIPLRHPATSSLGNIFWRHSHFSPQTTRTTHPWATTSFMSLTSKHDFCYTYGDHILLTHSTLNSITISFIPSCVNCRINVNLFPRYH